MTILLKTYYKLTKPGIIYGNLLTTTAGFMLASKSHINLWLLTATLTGTSLIIASACVFNNYIDREIDSKMARTKNRALVTGLISVKTSIIFARILGTTGFLVLACFTNLLTVFLGIVAFFVYVVVYGISKRKSVHGTLVGSIAGALPPVAGYTAVSDNFDLAALLLFLILVFWQMPHFYAIAIYRFDDYKKAEIPALPIVKGIKVTKIQIMLFILAYIFSSISLTFFNYTGYTYLVVSLFFGLGWLWVGIADFNSTQDKRWARKIFLFSLVVIVSLSLLLSTSTLLP